MNKKRLLLVDDKPTIARIISFYLSEVCDISYCINPIEAIKWLKENEQPHLIVTDIRMPEMTGDEFLIYLKSSDAYKDIPVIILSSEDRTNERIRMLSEGAEDYVVKPFNPLEFKVRLMRILNKD